MLVPAGMADVAMLQAAAREPGAGEAYDTSSLRRCDQLTPPVLPPWCLACSMPLFLYNFQSKQLHGIFKAASDGERGQVGVNSWVQ